MAATHENAQPAHNEAEGSELNESKVKQMRRVAERTQIPTDKAQLIQYLSERIKQAEDALTDTEELLESQVGERQRISKSIEERNRQLQKLYQVDQRGLPQKIKQKLTQILTLTVNQKMEAEQKLGDEKSKNYQYKQRYNQLKWEQRNVNSKLDQQQKKEDALSEDVANLEQKNGNHEIQLKQAEQEFAEIKDKKQKLQGKYLQMKVALERMTDIKAVLNRFFGNDDLFDEKMDLKEQKVQRVQLPKQPQARLPSRQVKNQAKLKPLNYSSKNDDQDFWRGDFSKNHKGN